MKRIPCVKCCKSHNTAKKATLCSVGPVARINAAARKFNRERMDAGVPVILPIGWKKRKSAFDDGSQGFLAANAIEKRFHSVGGTVSE